MANAKVTLVIPHRNRNKDLDLCLESLKKLTIQPKLIVVDDSSDIVPVVNRPNTKIIRQHSHLETSTTKNTGLRQVDTEFTWFVDSDVEFINPDMLEYGLAEMEKDENLGVLGGEIRLVEGKKFIKEEILAKNFMSVAKHHKPEDFTEAYVKHIPTNNFLVRTKLIKEIGGFHPLLHNGEDKLASLLIGNMGYKLKIANEFCLIHHVAQTSRRKGQEAYNNDVRCHMLIYGAIHGLKALVTFPFDTVSYFLQQFKNKPYQLEVVPEKKKATVWEKLTKNFIAYTRTKAWKYLLIGINFHGKTKAPAL